jgi:PAS domain S-box-containing protein
MRETQISDVGPTTKHDLPVWIGYVAAVILEAALTALLNLVHTYIPLGTYPVYYFLVIMLVAYFFGVGPAVLAFFVGLILFDYFFVSPHYTFVPPVNSQGWAALIAYLIGTSIVGFATILMRRARQRIQRLVSELETEIAERKVAEEALRESEERFRTMVDAIPQLAWMAEPDGYIFWYNRRWYEYTGTTPEQMEGWGWKSVHDPEVLPKVLERWTESIATGQPFDMEFPLRGADGKYSSFLTRVVPLKDSEGRVTRWFGTNTDITERKQAEEALRETEQDLSRAQAIAHIGSWRLDVRRNELLWSDETYRIFGIPKGTPLTYEAFLATVHPDDREYVDSKWQAALKGEPYDIEHRILVGDMVKWIRETAELEFDKEGELAGGFGTAQDITDRKLAMEALERERRRIAAMESLSEAALAVGSFDEVLQTIAVKIREGMNSHSSTVILLDEEKNELEAVAACNIPEAIGFRIPVGKGFAGKILQERRTMYIRDAEHDPLVTDPHVKRAGIRSLLGTPLIGRRGAVGVVYVNMKEIREFSEEDRLLLEDLASRTALVIENARLLEEISGNYALLQSALLPVKPPEFPGYLISSAYLPAPRAEIGGDFYDFFLTESGKIAVLIGDVSGKGVPSASLATVARSTVRAFAYDISSPNQALVHANAVLKAAKADPSLFVTLSLVTLNYAGGVCYAIAGHPPPAIYRVKTEEVHFLTESGMLLGIVDVHEYEESETHLEVGDKLVLYTDGLSEARRNQEFFGQEGIVRVLNECGTCSPEEVVEALVRESSEWAGGRRTDDTAIIVIERTE